MLDALVSGTTDPIVLADLARGQLRKKIPALRAALEGRFDAEHSLLVGRILAHIDNLDEAIDEPSAAIEAQLALSRRRLSCCARSPASGAAPPK
jgi:transposase